MNITKSYIDAFIKFRMEDMTLGAMSMYTDARFVDLNRHT